MEFNPCSPAIEVLTENSISLSDSTPTAVLASVFAAPESWMVSFTAVSVAAKNCWKAPCWPSSRANGTFENVKEITLVSTLVVLGPLGMTSSANECPSVPTVMFCARAIISTGKANGKVKAAVASLLLVEGSYAVSVEN